jgi:hypothetical protein
MKRVVIAVLVTATAAAAVVALVAARSPQDAARSQLDPSSISRAGIAPPMRGFSSERTGGFRVAYAPSTDPTHDKIRALFVADGVFDRIAASLDQTLVLPRTVDIQLVDCGAANAFYDPNNHRIIVCYELVTYFLDTFRAHSEDGQLGEAAIGATFFAFFHELGHAVIHELDLASTGREEDAADQVATLILLEGGEHGVAMALSGARWFGLLAKQERRTPFWDEHGLDGQRFFNVVCMVFGEKPGERGAIVDSGALPPDRARRCPGEYAKLSAAWDKLLAPHLR